MVKNALKTIRNKKKITQRQLADAIGTSQQQIQRIEAGVQAVRPGLAERMAEVLQVKVSTLFPTGGITQTSAMLEAFDCSGSVCILKVCLVTGVEMEFPLGIEERDRVKSCLADCGTGFAVFTSENQHVALNTKALAYSQFIHTGPALITAPDDLADKEDTSNPDRNVMSVYMLNRAKPAVFNIEPDEVSIDEDLERSNIQYLFLNLDGAFYHGCDDIYQFVDEDEDEVMLNPEHCAAVIVPLRCVEPALYEAEGEGLYEDQEAGERRVA